MIKRLVVQTFLVFLTPFPQAPSASEIETLLGVAADPGHDPETRIRACSRILRARTRDDEFRSRCLVHRGGAHRELAHHRRALHDFKAAIRLDPANVDAWAARGASHGLARRYTAAKSDFETALRLDPTNADACNEMAWLLATARDNCHRDGSRAIDLAERALRRRPIARHLDTLGAAHAEIGEFEMAISLQKQAVGLGLTERMAPGAVDKFRARRYLYETGRAYRA